MAAPKFAEEILGRCDLSVKREQKEINIPGAETFILSKSDTGSVIYPCVGAAGMEVR